MLKNFYQNGTHIELFNNQNKDLTNCWKFTGKISKEFDKNVQGFISVLSKDNSISKMEIPNNPKAELNLTSNYVVFQIMLLSNKSLLIEIAVSDLLKTKKRLLFSSSAKEISLTYSHSKFPLQDIPLNKWLNLSIDVVSFAVDSLKQPYNFRTIDSISISGNCKIRRIFTMKNNLLELSSSGSQQKFSDDFVLKYISSLPKHLALPIKVDHENINLGLDKIKEKYSPPDNCKIIVNCSTSNVTYNSTNSNKLLLNDINCKNVKGTLKVNNYVNTPKNNKFSNKVSVSSSCAKLDKENKVKSSVSNSRNISSKNIKLVEKQDNKLRQKSSDSKIRTKVRGSVQLSEHELNNFKLGSSIKKRDLSTKATNSKICFSNDFKDVKVDILGNINQKIELIKNKDDDSIMRLDLDTEFEMKICDYDIKKDFPRMEDIQEIGKQTEILMNNSQIQQEEIFREEIKEVKTQENNKIESILEVEEIKKDERKLNNYDIYSTNRISEKKDNIEIIEEIYEFDYNADNIDIEDNDLKLNLEDSFFKEDITKLNSRIDKQEEENYKIINSQCNYYEISMNPIKENNLHNIYSSRENIKELLHKKENCSADVKKEIINEIFKESIIDIRDQCFSPSFNKLSTSLPRNTEEKTKQERIMSEENNELIYDSIMGYYYDPKTNNYYEFNDTKRKIHT